ncbi:DUF5384 family protein [Pseudomonas sp. DC3000-4b1]|uniref:DUF5384 family protein n=1 Tax=unclassified Pseudomonas TaxID=196821 RepID=UPI003CE8BCB7
MKQAYLALALCALSLPAMAQSPFDQLHQVEQQQQEAEAARQAELKRQYDAERARQEAQAADYRRKRLAAEQQAQARRQAERKEEQAEAKRQQARSERFEEEDRALALEERRLKLEAMKARTARTNDYIDAELRHSAAQTDVIQSEADATRNVSSGAKALMENAGEAEVNRSKKLFGN